MRIVITDGYSLNPGDLDWDTISAMGKVDYHDTTSIEQVVERCADANIIVVNKTPIGDSAIAGAKDLKLIAVTATGYNNIDIEAAKKSGVTVCNVPEYGTFSVAQHSFALLLELVNHVSINSRSVHDGDWTASGQWCYTKKPLIELKDKVLGIVGFGRIGQQVAEIGKAFGMTIIFNNRSPKHSDLGQQVDMETLFSKSDVVSLHCPLTEDNKGFVNRKLLSLVKRSAILINTSRGQLINEPDLADSLKDKTIAAAALDVLSAEPPSKENPLIGLENCLLTPHTAWMSIEARRRMMQVTQENISHFLEGRPQNVVNG